MHTRTHSLWHKVGIMYIEFDREISASMRRGEFWMADGAKRMNAEEFHN